MPATREDWIEGQRSVNQRHHRVDILAEISQGSGGIGENGWVIPANAKRPACEIQAAAACRRRVIRPAATKEILVAHCAQSKGGPVAGLSFYRLFK